MAEQTNMPPAPGLGAVAAGVLASRLLGFVRDVFLAYLLGPAADAFLVAFRLPNFFRRMQAEGSLGMAYGAEAARVLARHGGDEAAAFGRAAVRRALLLALPATGLLMLGAPLLAVLLAPGLPPAVRDQSALLLRFCLPYLPLCLAGALAFAHASALGNLRPQAWASALFNLVFLAAGGAALLLFGGAPAQTMQAALCIGVLAAGAAQAALGARCLAAASSFGKQASAADSPARKRAAATLLRALPGRILGAAAHQMHILAATILASFLASGGISALYFAERLVELPLGLAGAAIGIAALPRLSALAEAGDRAALADALADSIRLGAFFSLPATAGLAVLALPLVELVFGHGAFDAKTSAATALMLASYATALPALCAARPLLAAAHALELDAAPLAAARFGLFPLLCCGVGGALLWGGDSPEAATALGLGLSAAAWTTAWLLLRRVHQAAGAGILRASRAWLARYAAGAALMAAILYRLPANPGPFALVLGISLCAAFWVGAFLLAGSKDAAAFAAILRGSWRR